MRRLAIQRFWRFALLLTLTLVFPAFVKWLWNPEFLIWARNAHGMAEIGAWDGMRGVMATSVYWFFELKGRSLVTMTVLCAWIVCVWWCGEKDGH